MIIPVRVPHDAALHTVGGRNEIDQGHPLALVPCPACDLPLVTGPITLVYIGCEPSARQDSGAMTGAAVAVHALCSGPGRQPSRTADSSRSMYPEE